MQRLLLFLWLTVATGLAVALLVAGGIWSAGRFLAPLGLVAGLLVGAPQRRLFGLTPRWSAGALLAWGTFGLTGSLLAWTLVRLSAPVDSVAGFVAWASPCVVGAALAAGLVQRRFSSARASTLLCVALAVGAFVVLTFARWGLPWHGIAVATLAHVAVLAAGARGVARQAA